MSLYDILDLINDINGEAKNIIVKSLSENQSHINNIRDKINNGRYSKEDIIKDLDLKKILTEMELADLKDRLS